DAELLRDRRDGGRIVAGRDRGEGGDRRPPLAAHVVVANAPQRGDEQGVIVLEGGENRIGWRRDLAHAVSSDQEPPVEVLLEGRNLAMQHPERRVVARN